MLLDTNARAPFSFSPSQPGRHERHGGAAMPA